MKGRSILAVAVGLVVAFLVIAGLQTVLGYIYPIDKHSLILLTQSPEAYREFMLGLPIGAFIGVILSHAIGTLAGVIIGTFVDRTNSMIPYIIMVLMLLGSIVNFLVVPHPSWFPFADLGCTILFVFAYTLSRKKA